MQTNNVDQKQPVIQGRTFVLLFSFCRSTQCVSAKYVNILLNHFDTRQIKTISPFILGILCTKHRYE